MTTEKHTAFQSLEWCIERLAYMAEARAENASDRNDARSFAARATISLETLRAAPTSPADEEVETVRKRHIRLGSQLGNRSTGMTAFEADAAHQDRAALLSHTDRLTNLVRAMLENDPNELAADGGVTVLDVWRKDARAALKAEAV